MAQHTEPRLVLVVDSEPLTRVAVMEAIQSCGDGYTVEWAGDGRHAWSMLRRGAYLLILIDADTPGLALAEFARAARSTSPGARLLVIGRSSPAELRETAQRWKLDGYLAKPFSLGAVYDLLAPIAAPVSKPDVAPAAPAEPVPEQTSQTPAALPTTQAQATAASAAPLPSVPNTHNILERLLGDTRARCVLLITAAGYPVDSAGQTYGLHLPTLGALIAATYSAAAELASQLGNPSDFRASHHQGPDTDIYTYEVNKDLLLATVFGEESQAGAVWLFAKRAAAALNEQQTKEPQPISLGAELAQQLEAQIDSLFNNGSTRGHG